MPREKDLYTFIAHSHRLREFADLEKIFCERVRVRRESTQRLPPISRSKIATNNIFLTIAREEIFSLE